MPQARRRRRGSRGGSAGWLTDCTSIPKAHGPGALPQLCVEGVQTVPNECWIAYWHAPVAGHSSGSLLGSNTGVYVGCIWLEYGELLAAAGNPAGAYMVTGALPCQAGGAFCMLHGLELGAAAGLPAPIACSRNPHWSCNTC